MQYKIGLDCFPRKIISRYVKCFVEERNKVLNFSTDTEPLHRMRIASRRLRAALFVFKPILTRYKTKFLKKKIVKIGRVLGRARELDVQIEFLQSEGLKLKRRSQDSDFETIIEFLRKKRKRTQEQIKKEFSNFKTEDFFSDFNDYLYRLPKNLSERVHSQKKTVIQKKLNALLEFTPFVAQPKKKYELHQMRIAAKNLRYTLEILGPWCGARINTYIKASHDIQDVLGDMHEMDTLIEALTCFQKINVKENNSLVEPLLCRCVRSRKKSYGKFIRLWKDLQKKKLWSQLLIEI